MDPLESDNASGHFEQGASTSIALQPPAPCRRRQKELSAHTAAASNLGQMLVKICLADGVPLVNVVRRDEHVALLKGLGAQHALNSSDPEFMKHLVSALTETDATLGFDATGGGTLAGQILTAMEVAQNAKMGEFSRYGSTTYKQVYIYGGLDRSATTTTRRRGMAWGEGTGCFSFQAGKALRRHNS